ncbi:hypothetical protein [Acinetobacter sp. Marseille-Q1618]|uniref:hypothetical protein n=1 Tax=Acinetobacter sp. Marseille-Q1618 TaxID=2697502 RepID=UPI00156D81B3|nr:hypothetical protein [Acinetobacter sp. Marseille-Q1618]
MVIDARIPLMTQGIDGLKMLKDGSELADMWIKDKSEGELSRIYNESQGDLDKMLSIAPQSKYARWIMPQLQSQKAAQAKAAIDQQQSLADISKTQSEAYKNNQQGGGYALDNSGKKLGAIQGAFQQASMTGDKTQVLLGLNGLVRAGMIPSEEYEHQSTIVNAMTPDELKQFAGGINFANAKDPASIQYTSADNRLDNQTLKENAQLSAQTSKYGIDTVAQTAANKLEQDQKQFDTPKFEKTVTAPNGNVYGVYSDGSVDLLTDKSGNTVVEQQKLSTPKLSDKALNQVNDANMALSQANLNYRKIGQLVVDIRDGNLNLSAANQIGAKVKNFAGMSDQNSLGVENFNTVLNQAVNDVLMLAKGTQTEGDAQRAARVIAANPPRDNKAAMQVLNRLAGLQRNIIETLNQNIDGIYGNYGIQRPQQGGQQPKQNAPETFDSYGYAP